MLRQQFQCSFLLLFCRSQQQRLHFASSVFSLCAKYNVHYGDRTLRVLDCTISCGLYFVLWLF